jgi:hypothetical protein
MCTPYTAGGAVKGYCRKQGKGPRPVVSHAFFSLNLASAPTESGLSDRVKVPEPVRTQLGNTIGSFLYVVGGRFSLHCTYPAAPWNYTCICWLHAWNEN